MTYRVHSLLLRGILDSRGEITVEAEVTLARGSRGRGSAARAIAPGRRERTRATLSELGPLPLEQVAPGLGPRLEGEAFDGQRALDDCLAEAGAQDGLGANVTLALSLAFARACAAAEGLPLNRYIGSLVSVAPGLPRPLVNVFSGGIHSGGRDNPFQQIMVLPRHDDLRGGLALALRLYRAIETRLADEGVVYGYSASSGLLVEGLSHTALLDRLSRTIAALGLSGRVAIAIDVAAEHLARGGVYRFGEETLAGPELLTALGELAQRYDIALLEDPFDPSDEALWARSTAAWRGRVEVIGDDLFATDPARVTGILASGLLLKMDQIGTLSGTLAAAEAARAQGMTLCLSHRSGETEDTAMCDLAVALGAEFIKIGGPRRGDRTAKYNQLLRLADDVVARRRTQAA